MALLSWNRPVIGVTGPNKGGYPLWFFTSWSLRFAGARPVRIRPKSPRWNKKLAGLIVGGGADIEPARYGQKVQRLPGPDAPHGPQTFRERIFFYVMILFRKLFSLKQGSFRDSARDDMEIKHLERSMKKNLPILGICRGAQLINVFFKGTLFQDLHGFYTETPQIRSFLPRKEIQIKPSSILFTILETESCRVNALHKQGIKDLGQDLCISACESSGVIQAIEHTQYDFVLGVQWHPEFLPQHNRQRKIFRAMVEAAKKAQGRA